jgi:hypothetical protein
MHNHPAKVIPFLMVSHYQCLFFSPIPCAVKRNEAFFLALNANWTF